MTTECPKQVQVRLSKIVELALLTIRRCAEERDHVRCMVEANHVHNIPDLVSDFSRDRLKYYLSVEVPQYLRETNQQITDEMRSMWDFLKDWIQEPDV